MRLVVVVEPVGPEHPDDDVVFYLLLGDIRQVDARSVALVLHVEAEFSLLNCRGEVVYVFHHQPPVAHFRRVAGVFERLYEYGLVGVGVVRGKLTYLIGHSPQRILIGNGQHLVRLERRTERYVAQRRVECVFRRGEQPGALHLLIVDTARKPAYGIEHGVGLVDVACGRILSGHGRVFGVGRVLRRHVARASPYRVRRVAALAEVGECYDVSRVAGRAGLVGHPHFHARYVDAGHHVWQRRHGLVVALAEVVREKEVAVLLIVGHVELKRCGLRPATRRDALRGRVFLRYDRLQFQLAELHVGAHSEQRAGPFYQRRVRGERHVACLDELYNLVFLAFVAQLDVLGVKVEGGVGVVV